MNASVTFPPPRAPLPFVREFQFADGSRPIAICKTAITFVCPQKENPETVVVIGLRNASAVPVKAAYRDVLAWWLDRPKQHSTGPGAYPQRQGGQQNG